MKYIITILLFIAVFANSLYSQTFTQNKEYNNWVIGGATNEKHINLGIRYMELSMLKFSSNSEPPKTSLLQQFLLNNNIASILDTFDFGPTISDKYGNLLFYERHIGKGGSFGNQGCYLINNHGNPIKDKNGSIIINEYFPEPNNSMWGNEFYLDYNFFVYDNTFCEIWKDLSSHQFIISAPGDSNIFYFFQEYPYTENFYSKIHPNSLPLGVFFERHLIYSKIYTNSNPDMDSLSIINRNTVLDSQYSYFKSFYSDPHPFTDSLSNGIGRYIGSLAATYHKNGIDKWLVMAFIDSNKVLYFHSFLITKDGVSPNPVVSKIGYKFYYTYPYDFCSYIGSIKISPDGKYIISKYAFRNVQGVGDYALHINYDLYNFDNSSGIVTTQKSPLYAYIQGTNNYSYFNSYSPFEFSPNSRYLYFTNDCFILTKIDLQKTVEKDSLYCDTLLTREPKSGIIDMLLGPDNKIYCLSFQINKLSYDALITHSCTNNIFYSVITNPNEAGQKSIFVPEAGLLSSDSLHFLKVIPFPNILRYQYSGPIIQGLGNLCQGDTVMLYIDHVPNSDVTWISPDGTILGKTDTIKLNNIAPKDSGYYKVIVVYESQTYTDSYYINPFISPETKVTASGATSFCEKESIILTATGTPGTTFRWSTGDTTSSITARTSGTYTVYGTSKELCHDSVSTIITVYKYLPLTIIQKGKLCPNGSCELTVRPNGTGYKYIWSNGRLDSTITINNSGQYYVHVVSPTGCHGYDTIHVTAEIAPSPKLITNKNNPICVGDSINIMTDNKYDTYLWSNGSTSDNITVFQTGNYYVTVTDTNGCVGTSDTISIQVVDYPNPKIIQYKILCNGSTCTLTTTEIYTSYLWSSGDTTQSIIINKEGYYYVTVSLNRNCYGSDTIDVKAVEPPSPLISGDTVLCPSTTGKLIVNQNYNSYEWNTGDTTKEITINKAGKYYVTVTDTNGCTGTSNIIDVKIYNIDLSIPNVIIFPDTKKNIISKDTITFINLSTDSIVIKSIYIENYTDVFTLNNFYTNKIIATNEIDSLIINFAPKLVKEYQDSLIIEIESPCYKRYAIYISGLGLNTGNYKPIISVWMPDTTGMIGDINYTIPIYAKIITNENKIINLEYNADIRFDAEMYYPNKYNIANKTNEVIDYSNVNYYEKQLQLNCPDITITNEQTIIGQMAGIILVGVNKETPLHIQSFNFLGDSVEVETQDGKLTTNSCAKDIMCIRTFQPTELYVTQTSTETKARILSEEAGNFTLKIYDIRGVETEKILWNSKDKQDIEIKLQSEKYPQGIYNAILISPENVKSRAFVVVK